MDTKKPPTFKDNGYRRIECPKCGKKLAKKGKGAVFTYLGEKRMRYYTCFNCDAKLIIAPPIKSTDKRGVKVILWGPEMTLTVDLTEIECDDTIPAEN